MVRGGPVVRAGKPGAGLLNESFMWTLRSSPSKGESLPAACKNSLGTFQSHDETEWILQRMLIPGVSLGHFAFLTHRCVHLLSVFTL